MAETPLKVVIADDSETMRAYLSLALSPEHGFELAGEAANGKDCVELVVRHAPDIVVMDVEMPEMNGIEATREIMWRRPVPVLIFTSTTHRSPRLAVEAVAAGALDVLAKPGDPAELESGAAAQKLRKTLRLLAPIKVIRRPAPRPPLPEAGPAPGSHRIVALGASTGGPAALVEVLKGVAPGASAAYLLVQHMAAEFMPGFVDWLGSSILLSVKVAAHGDRLRPGVVHVAPGDWHMRLEQGGRLALDRSAPLHSCRPAVDHLFESVAQAAGSSAVGVLLTGMGRDGAQGLLEMRRRGGLTIAQDEASSVVYGMPGAAAALGAARHILPLADIGRYLSGALTLEERR